jgi:hypothetical protein
VLWDFPTPVLAIVHLHQAYLKTAFTLDDAFDSPQKGYQRFAAFLDRWSNKYKAFNYLKHESRCMRYFI